MVSDPTTIGNRIIEINGNNKYRKRDYCRLYWRMMDKTKLKIIAAYAGLFLAFTLILYGVVIGILVHTQGLKL